MEGEDRLVVARFEEKGEECDWGCERHRCDGASTFTVMEATGFRTCGKTAWRAHTHTHTHTHTRLYPHKCTKLVKSE